MPSMPYEIADFVALPVVLQSSVLQKDVIHYIYIKAYEPKIPNEDSPRALFMVNIPTTATEPQLRHLFAAQLSAGHIEHVYFANQHGTTTTGTSSSALVATTKPKSAEPPSTLRKRKRSGQPTSRDISLTLSSQLLPSCFPSKFHPTGSTAIVIFLDRPSRDTTLRACRKAAKSQKPIIWSAGLDPSKSPQLGISRYEAVRKLCFPPRTDLLRLVDEYMTTYAELEHAKTRESAKRRAEPDEDGFVTVTRGTRGVVKANDAESLKLKMEERKKKAGLDDFYRFQTRERRKEEQGMLLRQFEQDRQRVSEMQMRRGTLKPER